MASNVAALIEVPKGEKADVTMDETNIAITAGGNDAGQTDKAVTNKALLVLGNAAVKTTKGSVNIGAGVAEDTAIMDFTALLKEKVLPSLSWDEVKTFVKELKSAFGVVCENDLPLAEFEELKNKIKSINGVQLKRFLTYFQGLKAKEQQKKE